MVNYQYKELFEQDSINKQMSIVVDDKIITNEKIYAEAFELKESLCSENELRFGLCEAAVLKIKIRNEFGALKGKWLDVSMILDGNSDVPFQFGRYKVYSDELSGDRKYTNITAYDAMHDIINAEMVEWYDGLEFPISMKEFRNNLFAHFGITQVETTLIQDEMMIEKTIDADSISGKQIITAICELNGVFGHINRQGNFEYISLEQKIEYLRPSDAIYPGDNVYPNMVTELDYTKHDIQSNLYQSCEYEDFETQYITKLQIRQEENDIGAVYGDGTNCYIVEDNFLVYGKSADELSRICTRLFGKISGVRYRPFKAAVKGNPCFEVGDLVNVQAKYKDIEGYVLERTTKGIQALKDSFEAKGVYEYKEKVNSVQRDIKRLKGKTNVLMRTVEKMESIISDEETGLQTQIKQTSDKVEVMARDDYVSSKISVELGKILLKGNRIAIESDYFTLAEDGSLEATNALIKGVFRTSEGDFSTVIKNGATYIYGSDETNHIGLITPLGYSSTGVYEKFGICLNDTAQSIQFSIENANNPNHYTWYYAINNGDENINMPYRHLWYGEEYHGGGMVVKGGMTIDEAANLLTGDILCRATLHAVRGEFEGLAVSGTKSRLAKTKSYNDRLLYCYEMPSPFFGDVGHGVIGEDGLCYIDIDQIFFETVDMNQSYQVFLQSYAESNVYVIEKQPQYFVVKGEPNTEFDWEVKAKQLDFPIERLEEQMPEDDYEETDYVASASAYLSEYEKEVLNYE